ncbi:cytochrome b [Roseibium sp.]|uniref:cytochrome b n=1 Tax=Roseibium sp. TaxID=1936156 RepID=UPI003D0B7661
MNAGNPFRKSKQMPETQIQTQIETQVGHRYSRLQILLHWSVVILVLEQWITSSAIPRTHDPFLTPSKADLLMHLMHNYAGMLIGTLMVIRLGLLFLNPRQVDPGLPRWQAAAAQAVHWALYLSLLGQASTGFVASYLWKGAVPFHQLFWTLTLSLVSLHVLAAAYHLVRRDGVVGRMVP